MIVAVLITFPIHSGFVITHTANETITLPCVTADKKSLIMGLFKSSRANNTNTHLKYHNNRTLAIRECKNNQSR